MRNKIKLTNIVFNCNNLLIYNTVRSSNNIRKRTKVRV